MIADVDGTKHSSKVAEIVDTVGQNIRQLRRWLKDGVDDKNLKVLKRGRVVNEENGAEVQSVVVRS